jgi:hypothetical protein
MRNVMGRLVFWCAVLLPLSASSAPAAQGGCGAEAARGHLGVRIACDCTVSSAPSDARPWRFRSAILVDAVEAGGPADGVLQAGDVIVAAGGGAPAVDPASRRARAADD